MSVIILGSGPAGLMAAHAVRYFHGKAPTILTARLRSPIGGAQFLHEPIPGVTDEKPDARLKMTHMGTERGYASNVYGDENAPTSWGSYEAGYHDIWNMQAAYDRLLEMNERYVTQVTVDRADIDLLVTRGHTVISSIPLSLLCPPDDGHMFTSQDVWIRYGPDVAESLGDCEIVYNGYKSGGWYRSSRIFGVGSEEFSRDPGWYESQTIKVTKPLATTFKGPEGVILVGRYGKWRKRELVHNAFFDIASRKDI